MSRNLSVLSPVGFPPRVRARGLAPGLDGLEGKTVFLVDIGFENSDVFMRQLQGWLAVHEPGVRTEVVRWRNQHLPDPVLCERIRGEGDAAVLGVGL
jgi:hypothetical protein